jgi:hypothetical protein
VRSVVRASVRELREELKAAAREARRETRATTRQARQVDFGGLASELELLRREALIAARHATTEALDAATDAVRRCRVDVIRALLQDRPAGS